MKRQTVTTDPAMRRGALLSDCGRFRYTLDRVWASNLATCVFVMLNPSVADAKIDDSTIRRCIAFAKREGCGALRVVNLFAFRSPSPEKMFNAADPVGPQNNEFLDAVLKRAAADGGPVIAAWGVHGRHFDRDAYVAHLAAQHGVALRCLGVTKDGAPRHPLYIAADEPLVAWPQSEEGEA